MNEHIRRNQLTAQRLGAAALALFHAQGETPPPPIPLRHLVSSARHSRGFLLAEYAPVIEEHVPDKRTRELQDRINARLAILENIKQTFQDRLEVEKQQAYDRGVAEIEGAAAK
jgi:hypothetical protein